MANDELIQKVFADLTKNKKRQHVQKTDKGLALYHVVAATEGFDVTADKLFTILRDAEEKFPGKPRYLYLDIEGHRNAQGGFDADMVELQQQFVLGFLSSWLAEVHMPLAQAKNNLPQRNDIPARLTVR